MAASIAEAWAAAHARVSFMGVKLLAWGDTEGEGDLAVNLEVSEVLEEVAETGSSRGSTDKKHSQREPKDNLRDTSNKHR